MIISHKEFPNFKRYEMDYCGRPFFMEVGKMADVVLWNGDLLSVYSRPEKVWIDGAVMYDTSDPKRRPMTDFELGQPGMGDVK